jgi:hypothetical protein
MGSNSEASLRRYAQFTNRSFAFVQDDKVGLGAYLTKKPGLSTGFSYKNNTY